MIQSIRKVSGALRRRIVCGMAVAVVSALLVGVSGPVVAQSPDAGTVSGTDSPATAPTAAPPASSVPAVPAPSASTPLVEPGPAVDMGPAVPAPAATSDPALAVDQAEIPAAPAATHDAAQHDLTPMGMFWAADLVVKGVMILLVVASVVTWTILLMKVGSLMFAKRRMRKAIDSLRVARDITHASSTIGKGVGARLLSEALAETELSQGLPKEGIKERVYLALSQIEIAVAKHMGFGTGILATIGSVAPFVGLFGTVWGIMRSFIGIAQSNTTNLAVVAPGIAEALLATGIGLVAAIPAVVIYNALSRSINGYRGMTADAVALIMRHLSRDLDRHELQTSIDMRQAAE